MVEVALMVEEVALIVEAQEKLLKTVVLVVIVVVR
jgi:hypothetical protein